MDTMQIKSRLGNSLISKIINKKLKKSLKCGTAKVAIQSVEAKFNEDGYLTLHLEGDVSIHESDLLGLLLGGE